LEELKVEVVGALELDKEEFGLQILNRESYPRD
jgi:hypothetical protein